MRQTENIVERRGFPSVVVPTFVPGFSTVAPPVAGALRMGDGVFFVAAPRVDAARVTGGILRAQVQAVPGRMAEHALLAAFVVVDGSREVVAEAPRRAA